MDSALATDVSTGVRVGGICVSAPVWHRYCSRAGMIDVALSVLALVAGGLTLELYAASSAPRDHQEEEGFHLDVEAPKHVEDCPSGQPA